MSSPSPICLVNGVSIPVASNGVTGVNVAGGTSVSIKLASNAGVTSWNCFCSSTDGYNPNSTTALVNATIVNNFTGYSLTFTTPVTDGYYGSSMQWTSIINANTNSASQITFGIFVPNINGTRLFFNGENTESNSIYGVSYDLNAAIVQGSQTMGGDVSGTTASSVVTKLQTNSIQSGSLGLTQDGYVLTWVNSASQYQVRPVQGTVSTVLTVKSVTANYNALLTDQFIGVGTISADITITLPASPTSGLNYIIKDIAGSVTGTHTITISGNGNNIDSVPYIILSVAYASVRLVYSGTQWSIL